MKKQLITFLQYAIPLALGVALMGFLFRNISITELLEPFRKANYGWIILSWVMALAAHLSRAYRWKLLLQPLGHNPKLQNTFLAVMIGYFANFALPRLGEVTRCGVLKTTDNVPLNAGFGTVVAERVFDLLMLLLVIGFTFLLEFSRLQEFFTNFLGSKIAGYQELLNRAWLVLVILAGLFVVLAGLGWYLRKKILQNAFALKIVNFIKGIWSGVISVKDLKKKGEFVFHTIFIWVMYYGMTYVVFFALPQTAGLDWRAGFVIFVVGSFGMAAPVQGGIGPFHILVSQALSFYGLSENDGKSLATFMHASQMLLLLGVGAVCAVIYWFFSRNRLNSFSNQVIEMSKSNNATEKNDTLK